MRDPYILGIISGVSIVFAILGVKYLIVLIEEKSRREDELFKMNKRINRMYVMMGGNLDDD